MKHFTNSNATPYNLQDEKLYFNSNLDIKGVIQLFNQTDGPCPNFQLRIGKSYFISNKTVKVQILTCRRGRVYKEASKNDDEKKQRNTSTSYPTSEEERCKFYFNVYQDTTSERYFIRQNSGFCWSHNDHPPISREFQEDRLANVPEAPLQIASELLKRLVPTAIVSKYLNTETGLSLNSSSIEYLRSLVLRDKHGTTSDETTAQKLIKMLDSNKGVSYVTLTG